MDLHVCSQPDLVIYSEFHCNLVRGSGAMDSQNLAILINLYYHTSRDSVDEMTSHDDM